MLRRILIITGAVLLLMVAALPAAANTLNVKITATCGCDYTVEVSGTNTPGNVPLTIHYSFKVLSQGVTYTVSGDVNTNSDANGNFHAIVPGIPLPNGCQDQVSFFDGSSSLSTGEVPLVSSGGIELPEILSCTETHPGKSLEIGPSSMEGHLQIRAGDWISGGYSFKFVSNTHAASTVTVSSTLTIPFTCPQGGGTGGQFVINLGTHDYNVPAKNTDWQPTGDANNVLSWAGSGHAPDGCNGQIMDNSKGAIWDATISQNPDNGSLLNWRFKYRDPNAKGKGNVNCLDVTDPRRAKADVCGASWSETVRDP